MTSPTDGTPDPRLLSDEALQTWLGVLRRIPEASFPGERLAAHIAALSSRCSPPAFDDVMDRIAVVARSWRGRPLEGLDRITQIVGDHTRHALEVEGPPVTSTGLPAGMEEFAFACLTGDCPHETQAECDAWVRAELVETTRENNRLHTEKAQLEAEIADASNALGGDPENYDSLSLHAAAVASRCSQLEADAADMAEALNEYRSEVDATSTVLSEGPYKEDFTSISAHARAYVFILNRLPLCPNCHGSGNINSGEDADDCPDCKGPGLDAARLSGTSGGQ